MKDQFAFHKAASYCGSVSIGGITAYVGGFAADGTELIYLCLFGPSLQNIKSVWASLLSGRTLEIGEAHTTVTRRAGPYDHFIRPIRTIGWHALLAWDRQATVHLQIGHDFYVLSAIDNRPVELFAQRLDLALLVPMRPGWGGYLWGTGKRHGLITHLEPVHGISGWKVSVTAQAAGVWSEIIQQGITEGEIR